MFEEFVKAQPLLSIVLFSFVITAVLTFLYRILTKQEEIKALKAQTKELQAKIKAETNKEKQLELQKKMWEISGELMRHSMKPTLVTMLPLLFIVLWWLPRLYAGVGAIIPWNIKIPILCSILPGLCDGAGWLLCYIIFSTFFSITLRKIFKIY
jgi:uncharacterized membrane protein (DUF106 family)